MYHNVTPSPISYGTAPCENLPALCPFHNWIHLVDLLQKLSFSVWDQAHQILSEKGSALNFKGSKSFPFRVGPFWKGGRTILTEMPSLKVSVSHK